MSRRPVKVSQAQVSAWEDDPADGVLVDRPLPDLTRSPLAFAIVEPAPAPQIYPPNSVQFRYWTAAEALRRGGDFWARIVPLTNWQVGARLDVVLDAGEELNAFYDRKALNFFHGPNGRGGIVYSGESPDIVCHEMGHAILDTIKPQLWGVASLEVGAFHESFADISAILSALQLPSLRSAILEDTGGHLYRSSRLSRLAEQLGAAIRVQAPDAVEPDCLRNAVNSFSYQPPAKLPPRAPASQLSSEVHSFSRLFTGAAFEILAAILRQRAGASEPTEAQLLAAGDDLGEIVTQGVQAAAVVSNWYAQVAASMVHASERVDAAYPGLLKAVFTRRGILSLHSAASLHKFQAAAAASAAGPVPVGDAPLATIALLADHYGLGEPVLVEAASQARPFAAMSMVGDDSLEPASASEAARNFVDDLFRRGRVDYAGNGIAEAAPVHMHGHRPSHTLVREATGLRLQRLLFECGFCH